MKIPETYNNITVPTLILDEAKCRRNIARMAAKARANGVRFRPHFKTHQSADVGAWFRDEGVSAITASSLRMASYFADHGWSDITVGVPVNIREIDLINALATRIKLGVLVDSLESVDFLSAHVRAPISVWIEVEAGYPRTGVMWEHPEDAIAIAERLQGSERLRLRGLLTHAGHLYAAHGAAEVERGYRLVVERLTSVQTALAAAGFNGLEISIGDTPSTSIVSDLGTVDEIRPGNFVYYDVMQSTIGSCTTDDIAVAVACPVISKNRYRQQVAIYAGSVHLSRDFLTDQEGTRSFGLVALPTDRGWSEPLSGAYVVSVAQEQSVVALDAETWQQLAIGDVLMVLPVHSCLTADLLKEVVTLEGKSLPMLQLSEL